MRFKVLAGLIFICLLTGCNKAKDTTEVSENNEDTKYFKIISSEHYGDIMYDTRTGVQYWCSRGGYNSGTLTILVDKDGKPLIYEE